MTARLAGGFLTRADLGLRTPTSLSRNITPAQGGGAVHYGGPAQRITAHTRCLTVWKGWQNYHMDAKRWSDIAYTGGFCDHGWAFAGRGHGVRTAANGTNDGNQRFHAYVWLGGEGEVPTPAALDALDWWLLEGRRVGGNGDEVRKHGYFRDTSCPGPECTRHAALRHLKSIPTPAAPPTPSDPITLETEMFTLIETTDTKRLYAISGARAVHLTWTQFLGYVRTRLFSNKMDSNGNYIPQKADQGSVDQVLSTLV